MNHQHFLDSISVGYAQPPPQRPPQWHHYPSQPTQHIEMLDTEPRCITPSTIATAAAAAAKARSSSSLSSGCSASTVPTMVSATVDIVDIDGSGGILQYKPISRYNYVPQQQQQQQQQHLTGSLSFVFIFHFVF